MERPPAADDDAIRTLDLLWSRGPAPSRGPRRALSLPRIVDTAVAIADDEGLRALSMRRLAEEVGMTTMALYRYVPSKSALLALMMDGVIGEIESPAAGAGWRERLTRWAHHEAAMYRLHPWVLRLPVASPPLGPNAVRLLDAVLESVADTGLGGDEMMDVVTVITSYTRGHAEVLLGVHGAPADAAAADDWSRSYGRLLRHVVDPARHPSLARLVDDGVLDDPARVSSATFDFGLQRILDGVQALIEQRPR